MSDANELVNALKRSALEAVKASKPVNVFLGDVVSAVPLKISIDQKLVLGEIQLILTRNVTDFKTKISAGNIQNFYYTGTDSGTVPVSPPHVHAVGEMEITVHNGLAAGDQVLLVRQQEGQKFVVLDRVGI